MNRIVNTNFTGEQFEKMRGMTTLHAEEKDIVRDLFTSLYVEDLLSECYDEDEMIAFLNALIEIRVGSEVNEASAKFLDEKDSIFVYHHDINDMSKRELLCLYLNTFCSWTYVFKFSVEDDGKIYKLKDLYKGLKKFVTEDLGLSRYKIMKYPDFQEHLRKHALVKPKGTMFDTIRIGAESVCGLPQRKKI